MLGAGAFLGGLGLGILLQQILLAILYSMVMMEYHMHLEWNMGCLLTTAACFGGCYLLALLRCRRRFRKMNIYALMNSRRKNEEIRESHERTKRLLLPLSLLFLASFALMLFFYKAWDDLTILGFLIGLVLTIYLFYTGVAAWIICYIRKKGNCVFRGQNLFLLRQFASKVKTLRFTLGSLTSLFVLALLGCAIAMMFNDYQNRTLLQKWPFDVLVFSSETTDDFRKELDILYRESDVKDFHSYPVYQNGTDTVNAWLYTHLKTFGGQYRNPDGSLNRRELEKDETWAYYEYDTYMALSDYNRLREMLGLFPAELEDSQYLLHLKERILDETGDFTEELEIPATGSETALSPIPSRYSSSFLQPAGIYTEPLSQDGHNGADYIIVVSDAMAARMTPYYRLLAANLREKAPENLLRELDALSSSPDNSEDFLGHQENEFMACGTDQIVVYVVKNIVRDNLIPEVKFLLSSVIFALVYIGLVFVCVALTVLSVQQLSDSARYRFRYQVLHQIGLSRREISSVVLRQLAIFYLCPILFAAVISGTVSVYVGWNFNFYTGAHTMAAGYFGIAFLLFMAVYLVYFAVTFVGFRRNVLAPELSAPSRTL